MSPARPLGEVALAHVRALAQAIGPRPAGSAAERQAFDYVAAQLRRWGYIVERQPVAFAPLPRFAPLYTLGGLALIAGSWSIQRWPWAALLTPLVLIALPQAGRWLVSQRPCTARSENLVAYTAAPAGAPTLLLSAHVDSARASVFRRRGLLWLQYWTMFIALRVALAVAALALLAGLGLALPGLLVWLLAALGTGVGGWWLLTEGLNQLVKPDHYTAGAHDNASGVGVVLALAEALAQSDPQPLRVGFLFTGAEETGMHGARAYAASLTNREQTTVINFDMVGAGDTLRFVTGDGTLRPRRTAAALNAQVVAAQPRARGIWYTLRSSDFLPFLCRGVPATSLQTSGSEPAELAYHTLYDTVDVIEVSALDQTAQAALSVIERLDGQGLWTQSK